MYRKNTAGQFICVQLLLTATGAVATGLSPAARRCIDGTFAAGGGTFTEDGATGSYKYAMAQADTNGNDISIIVTATGAIPVCVNFVTTAGDPTDTVRFGLTALPNAAANAAGGLPISTAGALDLDEMNVDIEAIQTSTAGLTFTGAGKVDASVRDWIGGTIPAVNVTGVPLVDLKYTLGTISPAAAGSVGIDWAQVANKGSTVSLTATTIATLTTYTGNTPQTGDNYARLGAPAGASIAADLAEIEGETDTLLAGVNVTQVNGISAAAANVAHTMQAITRGTVGAAASTTSITTSAITSPSSAGASGQFIGRTILFDADTATANLQGQASNITANTTGATPTFTVTALTTAPASGDTFSIV